MLSPEATTVNPKGAEGKPVASVGGSSGMQEPRMIPNKAGRAQTTPRFIFGKFI
jgi:hypothetical protein